MSPWAQRGVPQWCTVGHMAETLDARINTRIPRRMKEDLSALSKRRHVDESDLARALLDEGLRREKHPGVVFRTTPAGREAALEGRRLYVWQVMETVRASDGNVDEAAEYLAVRPDQIRSAVDYYAEYGPEIDQLIEENRQERIQARDRWERQQRALRP
jgi:uncharacterized protein (DUF433 family)